MAADKLQASDPSMLQEKVQHHRSLIENTHRHIRRSRQLCSDARVRHKRLLALLEWLRQDILEANTFGHSGSSLSNEADFSKSS